MRNGAGKGDRALRMRKTRNCMEDTLCACSYAWSMQVDLGNSVELLLFFLAFFFFF